ncbi:MAG: hypothetical protein K6G42_06570, partial [Lachnospiraceae bacterium]|nr:hypothetical protein [Lachnospiraceae bacterium]
IILYTGYFSSEDTESTEKKKIKQKYWENRYPYSEWYRKIGSSLIIPPSRTSTGENCCKY